VHYIIHCYKIATSVTVVIITVVTSITPPNQGTIEAEVTAATNTSATASAKKLCKGKLTKA
jgi:hypothetical protein